VSSACFAGSKVMHPQMPLCSNSDYTFTSDSSCNLDEANGAVHPTTGQYSYNMTSGYPWTPIKYAGDQGTSSYCSAL